MQFDQDTSELFSIDYLQVIITKKSKTLQTASYTGCLINWLTNAFHLLNFQGQNMRANLHLT